MKLLREIEEINHCVGYDELANFTKDIEPLTDTAIDTCCYAMVSLVRANTCRAQKRPQSPQQVLGQRFV